MTAMMTIDDDHEDTMPELPRFDDGMVNVSELARTLAESIVNEVMDAEADLECEDGNQRNGYRERSLLTSVGTLTLRIPKLRRGSYFPEDMVDRYSRTDRAIVAAVSEMVTCGVSTRKVERVAKTLGVDRLGKDAVSRMCATLDETVDDLQGRTFHSLRFPYLWLDATYIKAREGGHVNSMAVVTAIAAADDGHRYLVGIDAADTESYASWLGFLRGLRDRGITGTLCVTSDAHEGLRRAIEETFPGAAWQRCIVHLERNCCSLARTRRQRALIGQVLSAVFAERDPALVRALYHLAIDEVGAICPTAGELLEDAEADALAYLDFPYEHHIRLRTNNVQERTNREIKRRSRVVQVFPSRRSLLRYVAAALSEMDEGWQSRCWFSSVSIQEAYEEESQRPPAPRPTYEGTAAEHAAVIIGLVKADGIDPRRRAA
jgi:transposase-like protein